ncbi:hypothetical protein D9619_007999 [Psilocybe cf. subviscida]|uniref:Aminoglycoside phosphotransferase domain-containing protein n=1 Tax=Psilocybe cf. subviscida TaxID=2480587 RepID=A0A8H5ATT5_9AGAR|nr:hypothetical protein D9619_007999 [Psilocybe cf. subviscida]
MTDTSELIRIYDCKGIAMDVPACPPAETDWTMVSSDGSTRGDHQPLLTEIEGVLHQRVARWKVLALHAKLILQVELEDESTVVARKLMDKEHLLRFQIIKDECDVRNLQDMLHSEARVLRWLEKSTTLPIPRVMHPLDNIEGADFILQAMLPGETLLNSWSKLSVYAKDRVVEQFARASIQLFRLEVPQKIGSILASDDNSQPHDMKPPYHVSFSAPHTFDDIMEYVDYLIDARKSAMTTLGGDNGHLDELHGHIRAIYADVKSENPDMSALLRCAFVHADLVNPQNVLVTPEGDISGIIDWEFHLIHPAILAVEYPAWLLYDGIFDPRSAKVDLTIWLDSPEESARLRVLYKENVKGLDVGYYNALVQGEKLRACMSWLFTNAESDHDIGCARLKRWMDCVFK